MEIVFDNYILDENLIINFKVNHNKIIGINKNTNDKIIEALTLQKLYQGEVLINDIKVKNNNLDAFSKRINIVEDLNNKNYCSSVKELMLYEIKTNKLEIENQDKKMRDSLKIVGLPKEYINRNINTLSNLEKKLISLSIGLMSNPNVLIIIEPFKNLDLNYKKYLYNFYNKIKEQYNKTILFVSDDMDMLYQYTEEVILAKNNKIIKQGNTNDILTEVELLKKNKINVPEIVELTYMIKKEKNVKLSYHKDVRDILKDIYKHI